MFLDKKTLLKTWLDPGLNLTIFQEPGPEGSREKRFTLLDNSILLHLVSLHSLSSNEIGVERK